MTFRNRAISTAVATVIVLVPLVPVAAAEAAPARPKDTPIVIAGDVGTTAIRFREEWGPATVVATGGIASPTVGVFDATTAEFMGLQVLDGRSYDVTAFDGVQSGEVELSVPAGATLDPGTYATDATDAGTDVPGFFFHGYKGYAGFGTGSFTVLRSSYDQDGTLTSFVATYDEILTDSLGDSHVVGDVSWADTGDVPQVAQVSAGLASSQNGRSVTINGMAQSTDPLGAALQITRTSHGISTNLANVTSNPDGSFVVTDRPPCAGGVTYLVTVPTTADVLGEGVTMTIPLVRCPTSGGPGKAAPHQLHSVHKAIATRR
jgi:hypothetical protein